MYKVKVENILQFDIALRSKYVTEIILSRDSFTENDLLKLVNKIKKEGKRAWIMMERISRYEEIKDLRTSTDRMYEITNLDGIIIQNLDSFAYMLRRINKASNANLSVELNYTMNCYNKETKKLYETLYNEKRENVKENPLLFTAPVELNIYELNDVQYDTFIVYSYVDTMVSANCLRKNTEGTDTHGARIARPYDGNRAVGLYDVGARIDRLYGGTGATCKSDGAGAAHTHGKVSVARSNDVGCKNRFSFDKVQDFSSYIIDRKGKKLRYKTYCKYCYNKIFNTEPLFLIDKIDEIGARIARPYDGNRAAGLYDVGASSASPFRIDFSFENAKEVESILKGKCPESFTRGHFKTSIK